MPLGASGFSEDVVAPLAFAAAYISRGHRQRYHAPGHSAGVPHQRGQAMVWSNRNEIEAYSFALGVELGLTMSCAYARLSLACCSTKIASVRHFGKPQML